MDKQLTKKAKAIIKNIVYITIATVTKDGKPWNSPVYASFDTEYNFYWASWKDNQHSQNIRENREAFLVIYDSTAPEGTGEGVYVQAKAYELLKDAEIAKALAVLYKRKITTNDVSAFKGTYPRRIYKAVPEQIWINSQGDVDGNFVDTRVEVKLF